MSYTFSELNFSKIHKYVCIEGSCLPPSITGEHLDRFLDNGDVKDQRSIKQGTLDDSSVTAFLLRAEKEATFSPRKNASPSVACDLLHFLATVYVLVTHQIIMSTPTVEVTLRHDIMW